MYIATRSFSTSANCAVDHETEALYTSATFYPSIHAAPPSRSLKNLTAAEEEWLQEDQLQPTSTIPLHPYDPNQPNERFDWRLRASSRMRKLPAQVSQPVKRRQYIRRKQPPVNKIVQGEEFYDAVKNYEDRFIKLLAAEQADAEAVLQERLSSWTLDRLKEEGYCLTELSAYWLQENQFGRPVASFALGPGLALPDHRFENGTQVLVSRIDPLLENDNVIKGSVISSTSSHIKVSFSDMVDIDEGQWRLDVGRSNIIYDRMREAVDHMHHDPQVFEEATGADPQPFLLGTHLRDVLLRTFEPSDEPHEHVAVQAPDEVAYLPEGVLKHAGRPVPGASQLGAFKDDMRIQSWARRYAEPDPVVVEGDPVLEGLNDTQRRAVATMIGQRISLVQGPPGTGKTKTIIETVKLLKVHFEVPHPILVCTYTNVAVDNLVEGLVSSGVKALRVGSGSNVRSTLIQHTLDHKLSIHHLAPILLNVINDEKKVIYQLDDLKSRLAVVEKQKTSIRVQQKAAKMTRALLAMEASLGALKSRKYAMRQEMLRDVLSAADVICTTCITSACTALKVTDFPVVFLDEASMSTEPASLIPIMKGSRHIALIGDHKQLPPIITSPEAQALGLGLSLFERLTQEGDHTIYGDEPFDKRYHAVVPSIMLDTQYRMHPAISRFPSSEFYNHALQDGTVDDDGNAHSRLSPPASQHLQADTTTGNRPSVIFIDHAGAESMKERSRVNLNEAHIVASIVEDLLLNNPQLLGRDIGIIAPYVAQISLMTRLFNRDTKYRQRFRDVLGDQRAMQLANVEIKTVDGFEGREKEVIIFSTVRNNAGGYIGFLADRRRLNVGLTRARRGLFVVGNLTTLETGKRTKREKEGVVGAGVGKGADSWRRYAKFLAEHRLVVKLEGETLGQALYGNLNAAKKMMPTAMALVEAVFMWWRSHVTFRISSPSSPSSTSRSITSDSSTPESISSTTSLSSNTSTSEDSNDYGYGLSPTSFTALLNAEYPSLYSSELVHLDHAASPPPPISAISSFSSSLMTNLYSNPHSHSPTQREVDKMRSRVMQALFCLGEREQERWDLVWTSGTSVSLKLVGEHFPWSSGAKYRYLKESHTSLVGIRGCALAAGAAVESLDLDTFVHPREEEGSCVLHAYPAQCNVTGSRLGLHPALIISSRGRKDNEALLVDAAAYLSTSPLDLGGLRYEDAPDFVVGSFYKTYVRPILFILEPKVRYGYPTGLGLLLVKRSSARFLSSPKQAYFGGGAIDALSVSAPYWVNLRGDKRKAREREEVGVLHDRFENGTIPYLSVVALGCAMDAHQKLFSPLLSFADPTASLRAVSRHTQYLADHARREMNALIHWDGTPLVKVHKGEGSGRWIEDASTIAFTLYTPTPASRPIGHTHLLNLAAVANIHLRTGGLCNTGVLARISGLSDRELLELWETGRHTKVLTRLFEEEFGGDTGYKPLGLARISFGACSSIDDVQKFVDFLKRYFLISTEVVEMSKSTQREIDTTVDDRDVFLQSLVRYPIKSCAGQPLTSSLLTHTGLLHDREFVLIDSASGKAMSQKQFPRMALINPSIDDDDPAQVMTIRAKGMPDFVMPLRGGGTEEADVMVCGDLVASYHASAEADEWVSKFLEVPCQLHRIAQSTSASPHCVMSRPSTFGNEAPVPILFSNESPFTLISTVSVDAVNDWIAADHNDVKEQGPTNSRPVHSSCFRANFTVSTRGSGSLPPFHEDTLTHLRIGSQTFQVLARCRRCLMICVDQDTGVRMREPFCCLARHRRNGRRKIEFGMHLRWRGELSGSGTWTGTGEGGMRVSVGDSVRWTVG
ncbi:hypothetical protein D9615_007758 [Tricholomella constricta]|uniref:MOSC domain-containing protein n=1 Tax=Tricholomella constricta TaxID=117010 RepID=A0A8H5LZU5_9AGAR|nr:hypothetical protein D9615_007758 [Tricholomella constricta]